MYPQIICHVMGSVDGHLLTDHWTEPFNGKKNELIGIYAAIGRKLNTDAWMFGKHTLCEGYFPKPFIQGIAHHLVILYLILPEVLLNVFL